MGRSPRARAPSPPLCRDIRCPRSLLAADPPYQAVRGSAWRDHPRRRGPRSRAFQPRRILADILASALPRSPLLALASGFAAAADAGAPPTPSIVRADGFRERLASPARQPL